LDGEPRLDRTDVVSSRAIPMQKQGDPMFPLRHSCTSDAATKKRPAGDRVILTELSGKRLFCMKQNFDYVDIRATEGGKTIFI
jgi:hypothetical protein